MKLLLIADVEDTQYWTGFVPGMLDDIDLILSAGDLKPSYLSFLASAAREAKRRPYLLYVHGNHDGQYAKYPPKGCVCVDGDLLTVSGLRILGLGGSVRYNDGPHQYTEEEMAARIRDPYLAGKIRLAGGADIILTHSPPCGLGDREDLVHRGFECFLPLIDTLRPGYLIHGHVHPEDGESHIMQYGSTGIINVYRSSVLDL